MKKQQMMKEHQDPWLDGQKQITPPGWVSMILLAPFRLLFGVIFAAGAMNQAMSNAEASDDEQNHNPVESPYGIGAKSNWDGTLNTDGDPTSGS
jgi:hypothetical protein